MLQKVDEGKSVAKNSIDIKHVFLLCPQLFLLNLKVWIF